LSSAAVSAKPIGLQQENEPKREHHDNAQKLQPTAAAAFLQFAPAQGDHGNSDQETGYGKPVKYLASTRQKL
jgi:hypothetical protein